MKNEYWERKFKRKKLIKKLMIFLFLILLTSAASFLYLEIKLSPMVRQMAVQRAKSIATFVVSQSIYEEIKQENLTYSDLVSFEKDNNGKITALKTNTLKINQIKAYLPVVILDKLGNIDESVLQIPLGTILNGDLLAGLGPKIKIRILPVGTVSTDIVNKFTSAGINQTRHQMMLEVRVAISVIMPFRSVSTDVSSSLCMAETVIVGDVPNAYTDVERTNDSQNDLVGDLNDYSAENNITK